MAKVKKCVICAKEIEKGVIKTCSPKCESKWRKERLKKRVRTCKACKTKFNPEAEFIWWCSNDCAAELAIKKLEQKRKKDAAKQAREEKAARSEKRAKDRERKEAAQKLSWHHAKTEKACNAYIRERDKAEECISCDRLLAFQEVYDAGHFQSRGAKPWLAYDENNIHGQCIQCNRVQSANIQEYTRKLKLKIGEEEVDRLRNSFDPGKTYTRESLREIREYYKRKLKELKK